MYESVLFLLSLISVVLFSGCNSNSESYTPVTIAKVTNGNNAYYNVTLDFEHYTHRQIGKAYAQKIVDTAPIFEASIDTLIKLTLAALHLTLDDAIARATPIYNSLNSVYKDEIIGMQEVFNAATDVAGDGILSKNEVMFFQLFTDVFRAENCSASAAFGISSATGAAILERNVDWDAPTQQLLAPFHAVTRFNQGEKSLISMSFLGVMFALSALDKNNFVASLDGESNRSYPVSTEGLYSYGYTLRYALENNTTSSAIAATMLSRNYAFSHIVFVADENSSLVVENAMHSTGRGIRYYNSTLQAGQTWGINDAIATVNQYELPGNYNDNWPGNVARWNSFKTLYTNKLVQGKLDVDDLKSIASYNDGNGSSAAGSLFITYPERILTFQSYIVDMKNYEVWAYFIPANTILPQPEYIKLYDKNPF